MRSDVMPAMVGGVMLLVIISVILIVTAFMIFIYWKLATKAGYNGALSLLMLIPLVNFIILILFVFSEWPIQKELKQLRNQLNIPPKI